MKIYGIINNKLNKVYIGSTSNYKLRKENHLKCLIDKKHPNKNIQKDLLVCDYSDFEFVILSSFADIKREWLYLIEREWIKCLQYHGLTYNITSLTMGFNKDHFIEDIKERIEYRKLLKLEKKKIHKYINDGLLFNQIIDCFFETENIYF